MPETNWGLICNFRASINRIMSVIRFLCSLPPRTFAYVYKRQLLQKPPPSKNEMAPENWPHSLQDPTGFYMRCFLYFHYLLPADLRKHRKYFSQRQRGFGEEAFHVMWWMLFQQFKPAKFLEIGVYRGQTLSLAALLQRQLGIEGSVTGISPFASSGDAVSRYRGDVDYQNDTLLNFRHFSLPQPTLLKAYSTDELAVDVIRQGNWDCIYIDGNHDYEVAKADWEVCADSVKLGGLIILDDSALETAYRPPAFATGGHPGPSQIAREINPTRFQEILRVGHNRVFQKLSQ